mmetsp:Transcript_7833/g.20625  ORF Transcript_7833/g.20625 Transcript_7833/m.20625 type:complete len:244 (-) Transcript_7833:1540-2271(-)
MAASTIVHRFERDGLHSVESSVGDGLRRENALLGDPDRLPPIAVAPRRGGGLLLRAERQHAVGRLGRGHLLGERALERAVGRCAVRRAQRCARCARCAARARRLGIRRAKLGALAPADEPLRDAGEEGRLWVLPLRDAGGRVVVVLGGEAVRVAAHPADGQLGRHRGVNDPHKLRPHGGVDADGDTLGDDELERARLVRELLDARLEHRVPERAPRHLEQLVAVDVAPHLGAGGGELLRGRLE